MVAAGTFRADLYARLNPSARLVLPPLRARGGDLEELIAAFVERTFARGADRSLLSDYAAAAGLSGTPSVTVAFGRARADGKHMTFVFPSASLAAMRAHRWPGNVRELALVVSNALVFALSDALAAARRGTGATAAAARVVPVPAQTIRRLMTEASPAHGRRGATIELELQAHRALRSVARDLERQLYEDLYRRSDGDFAAMARQLLGVATPAAARKVRLRFNQLGLRARKS